MFLSLILLYYKYANKLAYKLNQWRRKVFYGGNNDFPLPE